MSTQRSSAGQLTLLQGTLDLLILRMLVLGPQHGQGIARAIKRESDDELLVDHGSLYPALQRLETRGYVSATWGVSDNNRRARFYTITVAGRRQVARSASDWRRFTSAVARILGPDLAR